jgi:hypothetical protein
MTTEADIPQRFKRAPSAPQATHQFRIGQAVRMRGGFVRSGEVFLITATLPPVGDSPQYRIRNSEERFERVATQSSLEPVEPTAATSAFT